MEQHNQGAHANMYSKKKYFHTSAPWDRYQARRRGLRVSTPSGQQRQQRQRYTSVRDRKNAQKLQLNTAMEELTLG